MCPGIVAKVNTEENYCRNLTNVSDYNFYCHSSHPYKQNGVYQVVLSSGAVSVNTHPGRAGTYYALCK